MSLDSTKLTIAVIVRTCDRPLMLARALRSIAAQIRAADEVVVVDAGSEAARGHPALAGSALAAKIEWLRVPGGMRGANLNRGLERTGSTYYAVLDDDDTWEPGFLEALADAVTVVAPHGAACRAWVVEERWNPDSEPTILNRRMFNGDLCQVTLQEMIRWNQFTINSALLRREVWARIGGYREDLPVLEDWEFNVRYLREGPLSVLPLALANYHRRAEARGSAANTSAGEHAAVRARLVDEWLRDDLRAGRFGLGALALNVEQLAQARWLVGKHDRVRRWRRRLPAWLGGGENGR